ncbi:MAG: YkgJ family cysteine cluster protein [Bermanella sp.]
MKDCNSCGKCCIKYSNGGLSASKAEIEVWQEESPEIAAYVHQGQIWHDPKTKQLIELCPFLENAPNSNVYTCAIYYNRPDDCRYYPSTFEEMIADGCEMVEAKDLKNPKKARQTLDIIMSDSRY